MTRWRRSLFSSALLSLSVCLQVLPSASQSVRINPTQVEKIQSGRQRLALAFDLLRERGVPFDPELLIDDDWRSEIEPALPLMPEMSETRTIDAQAGGVYLGGTILLPQRVALTGDTFILCHDFAAEDENTSIDIAGHHSLFIYVIGDAKINAAMAARGRRGFPPMHLNIDVMSPFVVVGVPAHFIGTVHVQGRAGVPGGSMGQSGGPLMPNAKITPSGIPHLLDPDFEAFRLASDPMLGWYSENGKNSASAQMTLTPDNRIRFQGQYSLRIEGPEKSETTPFLGQDVSVPLQGGVTRSFDLSVQTRGETKRQLQIEVYTVDRGNVIRPIAQKDFKLRPEWKAATLSFNVPEGADRLGLRFYPPHDGSRVWLDDVRLTANLKGQP